MEIWTIIYGALNEYNCWLTWGLALFVVLLCGYGGVPFAVWAVLLLGLSVGFAAPLWLVWLVAVIGIVGVIKPLRQAIISSPLLYLMDRLKILPKISETERTALEAGVVWVEQELFSGKPDFRRVLKEPYPELTAEEQAFIDGPVERLCQAIDEVQIWRQKDITDEVWDIIKKEKFLGMIIPREYGGLGFSALAHSQVIMKLATRSIPAAITVMVPNSLGPAELLTHYGTDEQKKRLLPRLATGEEIPCFALTEPHAGSDAGSIQAEGVLFKDGSGRLMVRLTWNKRWITLAAISTLLGVAFRMRDPENLLGQGEDLGITCALVPSNAPGVDIGQQHDPMGVPFYNCPTHGKNVEVPVEESVIGGRGGIGRGWTMLMESLAAGRGISLPAQSAGGAQLAARVVGAHGVVRKQFGLSIGLFEGVEEPMARIGAAAYLLEAARRYTCGALDQGIKPPVVTAIAKYNFTEIARTVINDALDIRGGAGISRGPRNILANSYIAMPISITVEGANILTRTLMIFGQGALRAHPYAFKEVNAVENKDSQGFDRAFWGHIGHVVRNLFRSVLLSWTRGRLSSSPVGGKAAIYFRKLAWTSASFAIMADIAMASLGGKLKVKEKITGRFADILSWMYLATAALRRFEAEGRRKEDWPLVKYTLDHAFHQIQNAFDGIFANMPVPGLSWFFRGPVLWWSRLNPLSRGPSDEVGHQVARILQEPGEQRDRLTSGIYLPTKEGEALLRLEKALAASKQAEPIEKKIKKAIRAKKLPKKRLGDLADAAQAEGIISAEEAKVLMASISLRDDAIQVDSYTREEYLKL